MNEVIREDGTSFDKNVPWKVEQAIEDGYTEIVIKKKDGGGWSIISKKNVEDDELGPLEPIGF